MYDPYSKVIITCALTGGIHGKEANPNLPEQPDEIVVGSSRVDLQACKLEYSIVSPK